MCISKDLCSKSTFTLAPELLRISKTQMLTLESDWPKINYSLYVKHWYSSFNFSNVKNFKTGTLKEYYCEHPCACHLESTANILLYEHYHTSVSLHPPTLLSDFFFFFWPSCVVCRIRDETHACPIVEAQNVNHWTAREVPKWYFSKLATDNATYCL